MKHVSKSTFSSSFLNVHFILHLKSLLKHLLSLSLLSLLSLCVFFSSLPRKVDLCERLTELQSDAPPHPWEDTAEALAEAFGQLRPTLNKSTAS